MAHRNSQPCDRYWAEASRVSANIPFEDPLPKSHEQSIVTGTASTKRKVVMRRITFIDFQWGGNEITFGSIELWGETGQCPAIF